METEIDLYIKKWTLEEEIKEAETIAQNAGVMEIKREYTNIARQKRKELEIIEEQLQQLS